MNYYRAWASLVITVAIAVAMLSDSAIAQLIAALAMFVMILVRCMQREYVKHATEWERQAALTDVMLNGGFNPPPPAPPRPGAAPKYTNRCHGCGAPKNASVCAYCKLPS